MASFDYNYYASSIYNSGSNTAFAGFSPSASSGTVTDGGDADGTFETGDVASVTTTDLGGGGDGSEFVGTVEFDGVTFAMFGPPAPLVQNGQYYFYAHSDTPINSGATSPTQSDVSVGTSFTTCFAAGTLIATPEGERMVETLRIGDLIATADGRAVPVKWIGRQTVHKLFTPAERFSPVRVTAGALGNGLPHTDLVLTADHALILDGLAINAGALVNGTTIAYDPVKSLPERVTYYHIETENHDVILANGAAAETYVDYIGRRAFDNYAEYLELYGEERAITEMSLPRVSAARLVPPVIRDRLQPRDRAAAVEAAKVANE